MSRIKRKQLLLILYSCFRDDWGSKLVISGLVYE